jgi:hypothetical protein
VLHFMENIESFVTHPEPTNKRAKSAGGWSSRIIW